MFSASRIVMQVYTAQKLGKPGVIWPLLSGKHTYWNPSRAKLRWSGTVAPSLSQKPYPNAKAHPNGGQCLDCGVHFSSRWLKRPSEGGHICLACQRRRDKDEAALKGTTCLDCGRGTTGTRWYKNSSGIKALCSLCYHKDRLRRDYLAGRFCQDCGRRETWGWHRHPSGGGSSQCGRCYDRDSRRKYHTVDSRACRDCGTTHASKWRRHPSGDGSRCQACFMREYRRAKARDAAQARLEAQGIESEVVRASIKGDEVP